VLFPGAIPAVSHWGNKQEVLTHNQSRKKFPAEFRGTLGELQLDHLFRNSKRFCNLAEI